MCSVHFTEEKTNERQNNQIRPKWGQYLPLFGVGKGVLLFGANFIFLKITEGQYSTVGTHSKH